MQLFEPEATFIRVCQSAENRGRYGALPDQAEGGEVAIVAPVSAPRG